MKEYKIRAQFTGVKERYPQMVGEGQEIHFGDVVRLFGGNIVRDIMNMIKQLLLKVLMILWQWKKVRMSNY